MYIDLLAVANCLFANFKEALEKARDDIKRRLVEDRFPNQRPKGMYANIMNDRELMYDQTCLRWSFLSGLRSLMTGLDSAKVEDTT